MYSFTNAKQLSVCNKEALEAHSKTKKKLFSGIRRFTEGRSLQINQLYLNAWKLYPEITKGFSVLLKIRITDFRGAYRMQREQHGLPSWTHTCPLCNSANHPEYAEHMIAICPKWTQQRMESFGSPYLNEPRQIALTARALGQPMNTYLNRMIPLMHSMDPTNKT